MARPLNSGKDVWFGSLRVNRHIGILPLAVA
jgi:hypothetical protein